MDNEGYPEEKELKAIKEWDAYKFPSLIGFIEARWAYPNYIKKEVIKSRFSGHELEFTLCTAGWSGNESIIEALLQNQLFCMMWYYSWQRGGKYVFRIDPTNVGFKSIQTFCKETSCTRQNIYQQKERFDWFNLTRNKAFIRPKNYIKKVRQTKHEEK